MIEWLRYVIHAEVEKFLAQGWEVSDDLQGTSHGKYAVLMRWTGEGEPDEAEMRSAPDSLRH